MYCEDSLKIKNLPKQLSDLEKEDLLRHFGATNVKIITSQHRAKCVAFAKFESKEVAKAVLQRLHQLTILNTRLCVEYAEHDIGHGQPLLKNNESIATDNKEHYKTFINKITAWNNSVSFNQPPPGHLKYVYPKANRATINNIAHALASVPKFYTQVLHLMNRMNLPPPFSNVPDPPQIPNRQQQVTTKEAQMPQELAADKVDESEESELESDPDDVSKSKDIIPAKRKMPPKKIIKRPKFIRPPIHAQTDVKGPPEDIEKVFDKNVLHQKKIQLKVTSETLNETLSNDDISITESTNVVTELKKPNLVITEEELANNRIPLKDLSVLNVFKEYHPGVPSTKLYIKNIAKSVEKSDLEYIYKRYVEMDGEKTAFDIKLMQEGRMKGQAFVTLDSVEVAQNAVKETNGYILKDKPLVVVFAKSITKK